MAAVDAGRGRAPRHEPIDEEWQIAVDDGGEGEAVHLLGMPIECHRRGARHDEAPRLADTVAGIEADRDPGSVEARVAVRFDAGDGVGKSRALVVPARTRVTLDSHAEQMDGFSFSTVVDGDQPLVVDRLVSWGTTASGIYGSHAETSTAAPGPNWLLAEGSTVLGFQLFYLLQNPGDAVATATVRFLRPSGPPLVRTYQLAPRSRTTLYVNTVPGLESTDVSAEITATQPIAVERAMYRSAPGQPFALGHDAAAVAAPSTSWFFGEGATGAFFDTFLLLANPSAQNAVVQVEYLRDGDGAVTRTYTVPANSRFSVYVDGEPGMAATAFGTRVTSSVPIVAERAMYWPGGFFDYYEGHVSAGATQTGSHWVLAEGEEAGPNQAHTFVLIANTVVDARVGPRPDAAGDRPGGSERPAADRRQRAAHVSADHVPWFPARRGRSRRGGQFDRGARRRGLDVLERRRTCCSAPAPTGRRRESRRRPGWPGVQASFAASCCRNNPTSVTRPIVWLDPRSASFVTTAGLMSTQITLTHAGSMLPTPMPCSIVDSISTSFASVSAAA